MLGWLVQFQGDLTMANRTPTSYLSPNWLTLILAVWLFISPWVFPLAPRGAWAWNDWIVAVIVGGLSIAALSQLAEWEDWINLVFGIWLFFSPWLFGYFHSAGAAWNSWIVGILIAGIAIWGVTAARTAISHIHAAESR